MYTQLLKSHKMETGDYGISFVRLYTNEQILEWVSRNHLAQFCLGRFADISSN